jgi:hypothetical protein
MSTFRNINKLAGERELRSGLAVALFSDLCHGGAEIFVGIDGDRLDTDFVVQVRRSDASGGANISDNLATTNVLAGGDGESREVAISSGYAVSVIDVNETPITAHEFGETDYPVRGSVNRGAVGHGNINAAVESAFSIEGIDPFTEGACEAALYRP